ncbi:cbb3-type cytochrome oxidase assembly protein CcoS [Dechloromonas sp. ZY10]|uniref:cbb3-type cytochrome oxidase assembly protein CcoS n=1 Tax=Dechloromonas aquae TaxID=2664436 RepID=UPI003528EF8C
MESVYLLIPVSVVLVFGIALAFWWSVRSGQFDDLEGPGFKVLMDEPQLPPAPEGAGKDKSQSENV